MTTATPISAADMPEGEYAIVEILGHRTMVGRVTEIDRFGTKMLSIEALFGDVMLAPVLVGRGSLYQFTPCTAAIAFARRPKQTYQLPPSVAAVIPAPALPSNEELPSFLRDEGEVEEDCQHEADEARRARLGVDIEVHEVGCFCVECVGL